MAATQSSADDFPATTYAMVDEILSKIITGGMDTDAKIKAVYDFLIFNFLHDPTGNEKLPSGLLTPYTVRTSADSDVKMDGTLPFMSTDQVGVFDLLNAQQLLIDKKGGCVPFSYTFKVMLMRLGIQCQVVNGYYINSDGTKLSHYWDRAYVDGQWYWYDVDVEGSVYRRGSGGTLSYFLYKKGTAEWEKTHEWDETATSTGAPANQIRIGAVNTPRPLIAQSEYGKMSQFKAAFLSPGATAVSSPTLTTLTQPAYDSILDVSEGYVLAKKGQSVALLDENCTMAIPVIPKYLSDMGNQLDLNRLYINSFHEGYALVNYKDKVSADSSNMRTIYAAYVDKNGNGMEFTDTSLDASRQEMADYLNSVVTSQYKGKISPDNLTIQLWDVQNFGQGFAIVTYFISPVVDGKEIVSVPLNIIMDQSGNETTFSLLTKSINREIKHEYIGYKSIV